jgi:hypothetical protein
MPRVFRRGAGELEKWRQQTEAAVSVVERMAKVNPGNTLHGEKWVVGSMGYYAKQAIRLASNPPRGGQADSKAFLLRLKRV